MARSPFTLAAAVTAAFPGASVVGARALTADGDGRFDSAVATLEDGRELVIRVADDNETATELAAEALALRALTAGARAVLPFAAPEYIGEARLGDGRALVTDLLPGFQIDAAHIPAGRGAAYSAGAAIAAVHALPASVVRGAGLPTRTAEESRAEIAQLVDRAAATGRVPARLTVRWREASTDDELWRFESTVTLGGAQATSFIYDDDDERGPYVTGIIGWHGLSVGDPAVDLAWLSTAPDAASDVHTAYAAASDRAQDPAISTRARLIAELEFARWLVHGEALHRTDIMNDAAALLESLADGLRDDDLTVIATRATDVESALDALGRVPAASTPGGDTSMHTDAYNPDELWEKNTSVPVEPLDATEDLTDLAESDLLPRDEATAQPSTAPEVSTPQSAPTGATASPRQDTSPSMFDAPASPPEDHSHGSDVESAEEAQRAARAALQRWTNSASE